jgi:hypothetical protein
MTRETLKNLDLISQVTQQSIADIDIIVPTTKNPSHYLELVSKPLGKCHLFAFVRWRFVLGVLGQV